MFQVIFTSFFKTVKVSFYLRKSSDMGKMFTLRILAAKIVARFDPVDIILDTSMAGTYIWFYCTFKKNKNSITFDLTTPFHCRPSFGSTLQSSHGDTLEAWIFSSCSSSCIGPLSKYKSWKRSLLEEERNSSSSLMASMSFLEFIRKKEAIKQEEFLRAFKLIGLRP